MTTPDGSQGLGETKPEAGIRRQGEVGRDAKKQSLVLTPRQMNRMQSWRLQNQQLSFTTELLPSSQLNLCGSWAAPRPDPLIMSPNSSSAVPQSLWLLVQHFKMRQRQRGDSEVQTRAIRCFVLNQSVKFSFWKPLNPCNQFCVYRSNKNYFILWKPKHLKSWHRFQMMYATESDYSEAFVRIWLPDLDPPFPFTEAFNSNYR